MEPPNGKLSVLFLLAVAVTVVVTIGAFTGGPVERTAQVQVAEDADTVLALAPDTNSGSGDYIVDTVGANNNQLLIKLTATDSVGIGGNEKTVRTADHVFQIQNQGTQTVTVYLEPAGVVADSVLAFYYNGTTDSPMATDSIEGRQNGVKLGAEDTVSVGVMVDTRGYSGDGFTEHVTVHAVPP